MTQEDVYTFITKAMAACVWILVIIVSIMVVGFTAGYVTETKRTDNCMNSSCEKQCKVGARFVRHQGCLK